MISLLALLCLLLGLWDLCATLIEQRRGMAEANVFIAWLLAQGTWVFIAVKAALTVGPVAILWYTASRYRLARLGLYGVTGVYTVLGVEHVLIVMAWL